MISFVTAKYSQLAAELLTIIYNKGIPEELGILNESRYIAGLLYFYNFKTFI